MSVAPSRRGVLAGAAGLGLASCATLSLSGEGASLQTLAAAKGLTFGSAIGTGDGLSGAFADPRARALMIAECGALVPENELKWYAIRRTEAYDFSGADTLASFAGEHDMALRGHTLLWHHPQWFPAWTETHDYGARPGETVERMVVEHIERVCARYPQVFSWDVVNETVDANTGALRETVFSRHRGQEVLDIAFHTARRAAPTAQLAYNDYMSWEAGHEAHRAGVLRLLEGFKTRGVPIDALGVQSHIGSGNSDDSVGFNTAQEREWRRFMDEVVGMGLQVAITEFDVHDKNLPADIATRDTEVAALGRAYLDLMLDYPQTKTVMAWGMSDNFSWLQGNWPRADALPKRPTLYDADYQPKPLRRAMAEAFRAAAPRPPLTPRLAM